MSAHKPLLQLLILLTPFCSNAQGDTITIDNHKLNPKLLTTGLKQYEVYSYNAKQPKIVRGGIWTREVARTTIDNKPVITVSQQWYFPDTVNYRKIYSVLDAGNFAPSYHRETIGTVTKAYDWADTAVTGSRNDTGNAAKDYHKSLAHKAFNWNLDIETFEILPLAPNKTFVIHFFDAGYGEPTYATYKVEASEEIELVDGHKVDCWILSSGGKTPTGAVYTQKFWISKKGHEFLKELDNSGDTYRVKLKMLNAAPRIN